MLPCSCCGPPWPRVFVSFLSVGIIDCLMSTQPPHRIHTPQRLHVNFTVYTRIIFWVGKYLISYCLRGVHSSSSADILASMLHDVFHNWHVWGTFCRRIAKALWTLLLKTCLWRGRRRRRRKERKKRETAECSAESKKTPLSSHGGVPSKPCCPWLENKCLSHPWSLWCGWWKSMAVSTVCHYPCRPHSGSWQDLPLRTCFLYSQTCER